MPINDTDNAYLEAFLQGLKPDERLSVSEWADKYRFLSTRASAEPGLWRTSRTPYLQEIMDCLSNGSPIERVVFMKGSQVGGTEAGNNWIGYVIDHAPGPMLAVQPTVDLAKRLSKQRLEPLIEESPALREKVKPARERDSGNTQLQKDFPGGTLVLTGANSAVGLRSLPARYLFLDEVSAYPGDVDGEGDPVLLAMARTRTFSRRKILLVSTPTITGRCRIESAYEDTDRRRFHVPCTACGAFQVLSWPQLRWPKGEPEKAFYECAECRAELYEHNKTEMLSKGRWIAENPGAGGGKSAGFHLSALYSPVGWYSWADAASDWLKAQKNPEHLRVFINTVLGETYVERGESPDWKRLYDRRSDFEINRAPQSVLFITAGVDVQKDRLAIEIVGWGRDKRSWSIDYRQIPGDTTDTGPEGPWSRLSRVIDEQFEHASGKLMPIRMIAIDSGYNTQVVYDFVRRYSIAKVIATKGFDNLATLIGTPRLVDIDLKGKKRPRGSKVWPIGSSALKTELYAWLRLEKPTDEDLREHGTPPGWCEFPMYGENFFQELTAEELQVKKVRGYSRPMWVKTRDQNEALDCRVMARACTLVLGMDRWSDDQWRALEDNYAPAELRTGRDLAGSSGTMVIERRKSKFW